MEPSDQNTLQYGTAKENPCKRPLIDSIAKKQIVGRWETENLDVPDSFETGKK